MLTYTIFLLPFFYVSRSVTECFERITRLDTTQPLVITQCKLCDCRRTHTLATHKHTHKHTYARTHWRSRWDDYCTNRLRIYAIMKVGARDFFTLNLSLYTLITVA